MGSPVLYPGEGQKRMSIRHRPMCPGDVAVCVQIIATHPVLGPRYGKAIRDLSRAWLRILDTAAFRSCVFEEVTGKHARILGCAASVFVSNEFVQWAKTPPYFWLGPKLTETVIADRSPLLRDGDVQVANSVDGLNVVVWPTCLLPNELKRIEVNHAVIASFMENHQGYLLKEVLVQATNAAEIDVMINMGGFFQGSDDGSYGPPTLGHEEILSAPHYFGITRPLALQRIGTWVSSVFAYRVPCIGFRLSEQRILQVALKGATDEEVSSELEISLSAVKKTWRSIYTRVQDSATGILPPVPEDHIESLDRGKGKKHVILSYVREHPEELRPISMRLLRQNRSSAGINSFGLPASTSVRRHRVGIPRST